MISHPVFEELILKPNVNEIRIIAALKKALVSGFVVFRLLTLSGVCYYQVILFYCLFQSTCMGDNEFGKCKGQLKVPDCF